MRIRTKRHELIITPGECREGVDKEGSSCCCFSCMLSLQ